MHCFLWVTFFLASATLAIAQPARLAINKDLINHINSLNTTWKAGENEFFKGMSIEYAKKLMGTKLHTDVNGKYLKPTFEDYGPIPEVFDARKKWPECDSIKQIRDQSNCGSCWAIAAAEAISDRICIATKGKQKPTISTTDLLACCGVDCGWGCDGGFPYNAWVYWVQHGLVTGGLYNSSSGCQPYPFPPCSHHINGTYPACETFWETPTCTKKCSETYHAKDYASDKYYGSMAYMIGFGDRWIQRDLMKYGPMEATIAVYEDFFTYKSGVYQHKTGHFVGYHAVRLLGWGIEQNTPYWLMANSWNPEWGEKGYCKVIRGENDVFIERECVGGLFGSFDSAS